MVVDVTLMIVVVEIAAAAVAAAVAVAKEGEEEEREGAKAGRRGQQGRSVGLAVNMVAGTVLAWREKNPFLAQGVCAVRVPCLLSPHLPKLGFCGPRDTLALASVMSRSP